MMTFAGMEKMSLVDYDGYSAATVFTVGCNMRCPFCQNSSLLSAPTKETPAVAEDEVIDYLRKRHGLIDALCITGGEPTLWRSLPDFIYRLRQELPDIHIKLDTNGTNPDMLEALLAQKLIDYVAMDIKNCREKYGETVGLASEKVEALLPLIDRSIDFMMRSGIDYEFRTTVVAELHTEEDMRCIGEWLKNAKAYYLQSFRDHGTNLVAGLHPHTDENMTKLLTALRQYIPQAVIRGI